VGGTGKDGESAVSLEIGRQKNGSTVFGMGIETGQTKAGVSATTKVGAKVKGQRCPDATGVVAGWSQATGTARVETKPVDGSTAMYLDATERMGWGKATTRARPSRVPRRRRSSSSGSFPAAHDVHAVTTTPPRGSVRISGPPAMRRGGQPKPPDGTHVVAAEQRSGAVTGSWRRAAVRPIVVTAWACSGPLCIAGDCRHKDRHHHAQARTYLAMVS
jgi:hypothetical protein